MSEPIPAQAPSPEPDTYGIGIDLGGSSVKAVTVSALGQVLSRRQFGFDSETPRAWAETSQRLLLELQHAQGGPAAWIGLSAPGLTAPDETSVAFMPGRLQGLEGLNWAEFLQWPQPIRVMNDAHAALFGEAWIGSAAKFRNVFMLTLGTGVGGAAMVDGRVLRGQLGRAGHLGHICLDLEGPPDIIRTPGSLEWQIGNCSIGARSGGRFRSTHDLLQAHAAGDPEATRIWLKSVHALACGIASLINVLDPEAVLLGGGIARAGAALFDPLAKAMDELEWRPGAHRVHLLPAALGEFAGAVGAARAGMEPNWAREKPVNNL